MSPLWSDRITLVLLDDRALLRRQPRGLRPQAGETLVVSGGREDRVALLAAVQHALEEKPEWRRPAALTVILGNSWARYATLPWADGLMQRDERLAYARLALRKQFGNAVDQWDVRLSEGAFGDPWLVAGVERDLISDLDACAATLSWRMISLQPALMTVANGFPHHLAEDAVRLVLVERERVVLARLDQGAWRDVRTRKPAAAGGDGLANLENLLAQEALLDPDDLGSSSRLCIWAFDVPAELRARWHAFGADVLDGLDAHGPHLRWRAR